MLLFGRDSIIKILPIYKGLKMAKDSRTSQAVRRAMAGERVRDLARELDLSESAVYAAVKRERDRQECPCCGSTVPGERIDQAMVKLDTDIYDALVAGGEGWQERLNDGLRKLKDITE